MIYTYSKLNTKSILVFLCSKCACLTKITNNQQLMTAFKILFKMFYFHKWKNKILNYTEKPYTVTLYTSSLSTRHCKLSRWTEWDLSIYKVLAFSLQNCEQKWIVVDLYSCLRCFNRLHHCPQGFEQKEVSLLCEAFWNS